jgi:Fe-S cluster biogenesis protein NfuA
MCVDCPMGSMTIKGIEDRLKDVTGQNITVVTE